MRWFDFRPCGTYTSRMKLKNSFLVAACAVLLGGCSSVPTQVDKGPVRASTYSLMPSKAPTSVVVNENRASANQQIQAAISKDLGQRGLKSVASGGQVQVGYLVIVGDNASTITYDEYFGYGRDASALAEKAHQAMAGKQTRDYVEVGALVIDVVDPRDSKLLYRSYAVADVRGMTPENRAERINRLVASCLGKLRVAP